MIIDDLWLEFADEDPPETRAREVENVRHVHAAPAANATREKVYDSWGRWSWADGKTY